MDVSHSQYISAILKGEDVSKGNTKGTGVDVAKFAWEIIKDTEPKIVADGAFTTVLSCRDTDPLNYAYAKNFESSQHSFVGKNVFGMTLIEAKFKVIGTYHAQNPNFYGYFLPSVYFQFTKCWAAWPNSINANAQVSNVSNIGGTYDNPNNPVNPQIDVIGNFTGGNFLCKIHDSYTFRVTGKDNVVK